MKKLLMVFVLCSLYGCGSFEKDKMKHFIPGTWSRHYRDEYTESADTITIATVSKETYLVIKKSTYNKINDQNLWITGSETKKWVGNYNKETGSLFLTPTGKQIYFYPERNELRLGTEPYKKL